MLKTVKVPRQYEPLFRQAEEYVAQYFKERKEDPSQGTIEISGERYILVRAAAMSVEFFETLAALYATEGKAEANHVARQLLYDIAHAIGQQDARNFHGKLGLRDPMAKLSVGPVHFSYAGWALVEILPESSPSPDEDYYLVYDHPYSFESAAWLASGKKPEFPVCIMNAGYSSGWCEESFGIGLVTTEILCQAKGDPVCRFIMAPPSRIEDHIAAYLKTSSDLANNITHFEVPGFFKRKETEAALRESECRFRTIFDSAPDGICTLSVLGKLTAMNPALEKILGGTREDLMGNVYAEWIHPGDLARVNSAFSRIAKGKPEAVEVRIRTKAGIFKQLHATCTPWIERGQVPGVLAFVRDVTEQYAAEADRQRLAAIVRSSHDAIIGKTPDGIVTCWNTGAEDMFGYAAEEIIGQSITLIVPFERHAEISELLETVGQGGAIEHQETERIRKDGGQIQVILTLSPIKDASGAIIGISSIIHDISERKREEAKHRDEQALYRGIFDHASDVIYLLDSDGIFRALNPAFEKITGWSVAEWLGQPFAPIIHPDDLPQAFELFEQVISGQSMSTFELRLARKGGGYFSAEFYSTPLISGGANVVLGFARDISERKQVERALRDSEEKFRTIAANAHDAVIMMDHDGHISYWNAAAETLFGYTAAEALGKELHGLLAPERFLAAFQQGFRQFRTTGEGPAVGKTLELDALRKSGDEVPIELSLAALKLGNTWNAVGIIRDISERRRVEAEIQTLNKTLEATVRKRTEQLLEAQDELVRKEKLSVLGQVAGSVGHELRNPLGVMNNAVYFLQTVLSDADETTKEYLGIIKDEIASADRIVGDLLDSVRTKPPRPSPVGVAALIKLALSKLTLPAGVNVRQDVPETLPPLRVDPQQMQQVFRNLISNGAEAMPEGGTLDIRAVEDKAAQTITVTLHDTGVGIPPENLPKLFQPLFTTKARGIGLGLVVVKNLIEANGGRVAVHSAMGKGTTFSILLPTDNSTAGPA